MGRFYEHGNPNEVSGYLCSVKEFQMLLMLCYHNNLTPNKYLIMLEIETLSIIFSKDS